MKREWKSCVDIFLEQIIKLHICVVRLFLSITFVSVINHSIQCFGVKQDDISTGGHILKKLRRLPKFDIVIDAKCSFFYNY